MPWKKGECGNPAGRPVGIRSDDTVNARKQILERLPELMNSVMEQALNGDSTAMKLCIDRVFPAMRPVDSPVTLSLPAGATSLVEKGRSIFDGVGTGAITPDQALRLLQALQTLASLDEATDIKERLVAIEKQVWKKS